MTTPTLGTRLLELAERCEAATGPDRELDLAVGEECTVPGESLFPVPPVTASLDAAMTLVPEGYENPLRLYIAGEATAVFIGQIEAAALTPALAICAAALRARAAA